MKHIFFILLAFVPFGAFCQGRLPVIKARLNQAKIYQQDEPASNWNINPHVKPDVFVAAKFIKATTVKFKTDVDSISFKLRQGEHRDFIVLLNGKDSCLTRIESPEVKDFTKLAVEIHDTIPFLLNKFNTNLVPLVFNNADTLMLNFDTGATEISFTDEALKQKIKSNPKLYNTRYAVKIGSQTLNTKIYDTRLAGNEADGLLGWDLFDGMIVELDYDHNKMMLHSRMPAPIKHDPHYARFKMRYLKNKPFIESEIRQSGAKSKSWFLFDLGYQRTAMLDNDLLRETNFPTRKMEVIKKVIMHGTRNNEVPVITANLQTLMIGKFELTNVPAQIIEQNKPLRGVNIHILGTDVLKRFNTVLDFQHNIIYLKPNHLYNTPYADQKKSGA
ncbi:hypothetical protein DYU05_15280 [Mucilaginibacter terrenus]|uniref:Aspartyl protease n=1 Tax=Mucilaginibacter terrenus TaxID=2482727 RepID=A0A3E2NR65_9SPHI|nr:hypothetical protein [Mucilaginibacter terrenus]RFZ83488.1 hypothetical protein DYU05_15280 [Mucilaginibacter terrenus]